MRTYTEQIKAVIVAVMAYSMPFILYILLINYFIYIV